MGRPTIVDLYCKAGGAAAGYVAAGFNVLGVDKDPQPNYPYAFMRADVTALTPEFIAGFAGAHASPPCQFGTELRHTNRRHQAKDHVNLIPFTRDLLDRAGVPYVIENVRAVREHLKDPVTLCGSMFDLHAMAHTDDGWVPFQLQRHRLFEVNFPLVTPPACSHRQPTLGIYGGHVRCRSASYWREGGADFPGEDKKAIAYGAMRIDWPMTMDELSEAIPPAYTEWLGRQLLSHLTRRRR